jgi:hypothetical protein
MSFDIFLQSFTESSTSAGEVRSLLGDRLNPAGTTIKTSDGGADIYGLDVDIVQGVMVNNTQGEHIFELLVKVARAFQWAIMPVGCPVCVTDDSIRNSIPDELQAPPINIVTSGADLIAIIEGA